MGSERVRSGSALDIPVHQVAFEQFELDLLENMRLVGFLFNYGIGSLYWDIDLMKFSLIQIPIRHRYRR